MAALEPSPGSQAQTAPADRWYVPSWLEGPGLPEFQVIDTRSAQGRLEQRAKTVTIADLVLFHGHACDGLIRGVWAMRALADFAFGDRPIDRSDLLVVSKNSPCLGDVAAYLTGGRARYGTHRLDDTLGVGFQIQILSTGECYEVREQPGFFPQQITDWEAALLGALDDELKRELLPVHETAQWDWVREALLPTSPAEHYHARRLEHLELPPALAQARRTDTINRLVQPPAEAHSAYDPDLSAASPNEPYDGRWRQRYQSGPAAGQP